MSTKSTYFMMFQNLFFKRTDNREQNTPESNEINQLVDYGMSVLDEEFQIPEGFTERILAKRPHLPKTKVFRINYMDYAQIAAVLAIGVFLGFVLGKHADTNLLLSKESKKKKTLIEYRDSHYLTIDRAFLLK